MTKPDRIPCITPGCRRTAPAEEFEPGAQIICGKCWKKVPPGIRDRYRELRKRRRKIQRLAQKVGGDLVSERTQAAFIALDQLQHRNWADIRRAVRRPDKLTGLNAFLEETGL